MRAISNVLEKFGVARELVQYLWRDRLWWMIPMVVVLLGCGMLLVLTQGSALAPFVYALF